MEGLTSTGFKYTVAEEARDDMELLDALIDLESNDPAGLRNAMRALLGEDQRKALYEHCRINGRVRASRVMEEFHEILNAAPEDTKN